MLGGVPARTNRNSISFFVPIVPRAAVGGLSPKSVNRTRDEPSISGKVSDPVFSATPTVAGRENIPDGQEPLCFIVIAIELIDRRRFESNSRIPVRC